MSDSSADASLTIGLFSTIARAATSIQITLSLSGRDSAGAEIRLEIEPSQIKTSIGNFLIETCPSEGDTFRIISELLGRWQEASKSRLPSQKSFKLDMSAGELSAVKSFLLPAQPFPDGGDGRPSSYKRLISSLLHSAGEGISSGDLETIRLCEKLLRFYLKAQQPIG